MSVMEPTAADFVRIEDYRAAQPEPGSAIRATPFQWTDPAAIPRRQWLYGGHLIRQFYAMTIAPGGVGKSTLVMTEALALATGKPLLGRDVDEPRRVWLWNLEDPIEELQRRIAAICQHYEITPADIEGRLFVDSGRTQRLCTAVTDKSDARICRPVVDALIDEMLAREIDVLIVDPFVKSHSVSENDNSAMDDIAAEWADIAERTNAAVELVHHTRKLAGDFEVTTESSRGAKALTDGARDVRAVTRMTQDEADRAGVDNHRLYFRVYSDKSNLSPPADKSDWYRLASVDLPNGDQVGVVEPWSWPDPFADITAQHLRDVQKAIHGRNLRENAQATDWAGHIIADILSLDADDKHDRSKIKSMIKTWCANGVLRVVKITDGKGKDRPVLEVGEWAE